MNLRKNSSREFISKSALKRSPTERQVQTNTPVLSFGHTEENSVEEWDRYRLVELTVPVMHAKRIMCEILKRVICIRVDFQLSKALVMFKDSLRRGARSATQVNKL